MKKHDILDVTRVTKIAVRVRVPDMGREFNFKLFKKTRVKEIVIRLCELLDVDPLRSDVFLYGPFGMHEMNHTSTLVQNGIENGMTLTAKVHFTGYGSKVSTIYKVVSKQTQFGNMPAENYIDRESVSAFDLKANVELYGVKILGVCVNPYCIAYNKEVTFPLGTGTFDINAMLTNTRCQTCPYKDRNAQKALKIKNISLVNCVWKLKGHYIDSTGFNNVKTTKDWQLTEGTDHTRLYKLLTDTNYLDPQLTVKAL